MDRKHTEPAGLLSRVGSPLAVAAVGLAAAAAIALRDPHVPGSWGFCPFLRVTGLYCPGCGGLRAMNDLVHLRVLDALHSNAIGVLLVSLVGLGWLIWLTARIRGRPARLDRFVTSAVGWAAVVVIVGFAVLRNTPWGAWLAPV